MTTSPPVIPPEAIPPEAIPPDPVPVDATVRPHYGERAIADGNRLHVGGLCNRDLTGFADALPGLVDGAVSSRAADRAAP